MIRSLATMKRVRNVIRETARRLMFFSCLGTEDFG